MVLFINFSRAAIYHTITCINTRTDRDPGALRVFCKQTVLFYLNYDSSHTLMISYKCVFGEKY